MNFATTLHALPLAGVFAVIVAVSLLAVEAGFLLGRRRRVHSENEGPVGAMVGAILGLLAFLLAFTFSLAASRFDDRRQVLLNESNAIGTAWLRAEILDEEFRVPLRRLLREYVDARIVAPSTDVARQLSRSEALQAELWSWAVRAGRAQPQSEVVGLFIAALNEVFDLHAKRVQVGLRSHLPGVIWNLLLGVALLALGVMGYHVGLAATRRTVAVVPVALAFAAVLTLIADLDRPMAGTMQVSQQALIDLRMSMDH